MGLVSYDDETATYRMHAFNDGLFLETELKLAEDGKGMTWGFAIGEIRSESVLRIDENGDWTESANIFVGGQPAPRLLELKVTRNA